MFDIAIESLSVVIQVATGFMALKLRRVTSVALPWNFIALGFWGMAIRRAMSLYYIIQENNLTVHNLPYEILGLAVSMCMLCGVMFIAPVFEKIQEEKKLAEALAREKVELAGNLQAALDNVKVLKGLLPICASCKRIRDEKGAWNQIETYIQKRTEADFTHGICPECTKALYGDLLNKE